MVIPRIIPRLGEPDSTGTTSGVVGIVTDELIIGI